MYWNNNAFIHIATIYQTMINIGIKKESLQLVFEYSLQFFIVKNYLNTFFLTKSTFQKVWSLIFQDG